MWVLGQTQALAGALNRRLPSPTGGGHWRNPSHRAPMVRHIIVLGGGTAGFTAALTLKRLLPGLDVRVVRSPDIGIIGVGEGTNITFAQHFIDRLKLPVPRLVGLIQPTLKLGLRLLWGPKPEFYYAFAVEHAARLPALKRANSAYLEDGQRWTGPVSALMAHGKAFHRGPDRRPRPHRNYAFHVENHKLAAGLETLCREHGVSVVDATVARVGPADVPGEVTAYLARSNLPATVAMAPSPLLEGYDWSSQKMLSIRRGRGLGSDQVSVTGAFAGIAETGTVVMASGPDHPVSLNLLPDTHVVVLRESDIVGGYAAWRSHLSMSGGTVRPASTSHN